MSRYSWFQFEMMYHCCWLSCLRATISSTDDVSGTGRLRQNTKTEISNHDHQLLVHFHQGGKYWSLSQYQYQSLGQSHFWIIQVQFQCLLSLSLPPCCYPEEKLLGHICKIFAVVWETMMEVPGWATLLGGWGVTDTNVRTIIMVIMESCIYL